MIAAVTAARWLHLAALMILFGSTLLLVRLRGTVPELAIETTSLKRGRWLAAFLAIVSAILWFDLAVGQMAGFAPASVDPHLVWLALHGSLFGQMFVLRLLLLLGLGVALALGREILSAILAGAALALLSVTSHAAKAAPAHLGWLNALVDAAHLLTGGFWIGGLALLLGIVALRPEAPRLAKAVGAFAEWGMVAACLLVMTGMINAAAVLLSGPGHDARLYLGVLGAKLVLVIAMIGLALTNHFKLLPRLARPGVTATLKGNMAWELGLGAGVLLLASLLGILQPTL